MLFKADILCYYTLDGISKKLVSVEDRNNDREVRYLLGTVSVDITLLGITPGNRNELCRARAIGGPIQMHLSTLSSE